MINLFTSDAFKCKSGGITTERGKVHDFSILYNIEDQKLKYSVSYGNNRNIHIFSTLEECNDYITKCKEIIIHNLLSYYKTKISQYTTTVNKIESKIDVFLS